VLLLVLVLLLGTCRNGKWSQSLITKNSTFTDSHSSLLPGPPITSRRNDLRGPVFSAGISSTSPSTSTSRSTKGHPISQQALARGRLWNLWLIPDEFASPPQNSEFSSADSLPYNRTIFALLIFGLLRTDSMIELSGTESRFRTVSTSPPRWSRLKDIFAMLTACAPKTVPI
jgi:hypothetical protein